MYYQVRSLDKEVIKLIRSDKDRELISYLKDEPQGNVTSSLELWKLICSRRAVKCATALLGGADGYSVNPNIVLERELSPLQLAAQSLSYDLIELLLAHGGQPNMSHDGDHANLPLGLALEALCHDECVSEWTPKKSIFKLFYILCLPELEESRKTVKLLASKTKEVETMGLSYVSNGQLVQFTALLMLAWAKLGPPSSAQELKECLIGQFICYQLELASQQENMFRSCGSSSALTVLLESKAKLESAWKILKVLHMSHDTLQECIEDLLEMPKETHEVPFYIAELVWMECKIPFLREDVYANDVKCLQPRLKPRQEVWLKSKIDQQIRLSSSLSKSRTPCPIGEYLKSRSFHTCGALHFNSMGPVRSQLAATTQAVHPSSLKFSSSAKMWKLFYSTARRLVK